MLSLSAEPLAEIEGIDERLQQAVASSEQATLAIGRLLDRIVELATAETPETAKRQNDRDGLGVAGHIASVTSAAQNFTIETQSFLDRQREFIRTANTACRCINKCADSVAALMRKSHVLAINMQIESARLKIPNTAFNVIGQEMSQFSVEVRKANESIVEALKQLSDSLPHLENEAVTMGEKVRVFDDQFKQQLSQVEEQTIALRQARTEILRLEASKNQQIVDLSHQTLSELQFQDPMAQGLRKVAEMVRDLASLAGAERETPSEFLSIPDISSSPIWLNSPRSAGELELF